MDALKLGLKDISNHFVLVPGDNYISSSSFLPLISNEKPSQNNISISNKPEIFIKNADLCTPGSNNPIIKIASIQKGGAWNARALLLLAKNFYLLKDPFQANYILESLLKTYPEEESVVEKAHELLELVKEELTKNNASVNSDE